MSENVTRDRSWRHDFAKGSPSAESTSDSQGPGPGGQSPRLPEVTELSPPGPLSGTVRGVRRWGRRLRDLIAPVNGQSGLSEPAAQTIIHDFVEALAEAPDASTVASKLIFAAKRLTGASGVALDFDPSIDSIGDSRGAARPEECPAIWPSGGGVSLTVPVGFGPNRWGVLRVIDEQGSGRERSPDRSSIRTLNTLCTFAALALDAISTGQLFQTLETVDLDGFGSAAEVGPRGLPPRFTAEVGSRDRTSMSLRDATYLNVILPYAVGQAHRHHEALSILYIGIDRLPAIRNLLGPDQVDKAVEHVGEAVTRRLRSSDVVSRMEDDRLLAMLPYATASDTARIAEEIRAAVELTCGALIDFPPLTVSIGVASFPTHSKEVVSLLDAADDAMSNAQLAGRNRVEVAELPFRTPA